MSCGLCKCRTMFFVERHMRIPRESCWGLGLTGCSPAKCIAWGELQNGLVEWDLKAHPVPTPVLGKATSPQHVAQSPLRPGLMCGPTSPLPGADRKQDLLPNTVSTLLKSFFPVNCFITSYDYPVMIPGSNDRKYSLAHGQGSSSPEHVHLAEGNFWDLQVSRTGNWNFRI